MEGAPVGTAARARAIGSVQYHPPRVGCSGLGVVRVTPPG